MATLSGERDIRIVLAGSGIEFRGYIDLGPGLQASGIFGQMILAQSGGPDHGKIWTFLYDDGPG